MDEKLKSIFEMLGDEVAELHYRWSIYEEVYAGDAAQTELLNRNGSNFFYYVQHLMLDNVALALSKLTDPSKQYKNENLSLSQIYDYIKNSDEDQLAKILKEKFDELLKACEKFRKLRNKRIAHGDLQHAMRKAGKPLPGISRDDVKKALSLLSEYMNIVELHYNNSQTGYSLTKGPYGAGGEALVKALKNLSELMELMGSEYIK